MNSRVRRRMSSSDIQILVHMNSERRGTAEAANNCRIASDNQNKFAVDML